MTIDEPSQKIALTARGKHVDMRFQIDAEGDLAPSYQNDDPATTTGSVQVTAGGTTTTVFTSNVLTTPSLVLATQMTVAITTSGTPDAGTIELRRNGAVIATLAATTTGTVATSNIVTTTSPTLDVRVNGLSATAGTATVNVTAITFSRESRW